MGVIDLFFIFLVILGGLFLAVSLVIWVRILMEVRNVARRCETWRDEDV
jgi:hypothetical protein